PRSEEVRFKDMCTARNFPFIRIGMTDTGDGSPQLEVVDHFSVGLDELRNARGVVVEHGGCLGQLEVAGDHELTPNMVAILVRRRSFDPE
ncbi:hypothetical protein DN550_31395, partial [Burkholderia multivorans]